jgi:hypothetical protein
MDLQLRGKIARMMSFAELNPSTTSAGPAS